MEKMEFLQLFFPLSTFGVVRGCGGGLCWWLRCGERKGCVGAWIGGVVWSAMGRHTELLKAAKDNNYAKMLELFTNKSAGKGGRERENM